MREIKFRAWDRFNKRFVKPENLSDSEHLSVENTDYGFRFLDDTESGFDYLQYTGLKDENGKEIYEGDIVSYVGYSAYGRDEEPSKLIIEWDEIGGGFDLRWLFVKDDGDIGLYNIDIEVIGNIYENPEMVEESK